MTDIDEKIRQTLSNEDRKALEKMGGRDDPLGLAMLAFRGSQRTSTAIVWVLGFAFFLVLLYCAYRYFTVDDLKESLTWGLAVALSGMSIVIVKIISWQMIQTQVLIREIKRLELRLLSGQK